MSDAEGKFVLHDLDPELLFELLVVARGYAPAFTEKTVDPHDSSLVMELEPRDLSQLPRERVLRGVVLDMHREPIPRAIVEPVAVSHEGGVTYGVLGADPLAITDEDGVFELSAGGQRAELKVLVRASGHATCFSEWLQAGDDVNVVSMTRGATVTGRVERDGKPAAGIELALAQSDKLGDTVGEYTIGTDAAGRFTFVNVPEEREWLLYGKGESCAPFGVISVRPVDVGKDESTLDVGLVKFEPGVRLSGRVVTSDGGALPEGTRIVITREDVPDTLITSVAADGTFAFAHAPRELVTLNVPLRSYHVSPHNESFDFLNHMGLLGRLEADTELVLRLDPGGRTSAPEPELGSIPRYKQLIAAPLRGVPVEAKSGVR